VAQLVRGFELEPSEFATHIPTDVEDPPGFLLEPEGPAYELVLRKRGEIGPAGASCIFLAETNDAHAICGAGACKPAVCEAYPATVSDGRVRIVGGGCRCHRWSLLDLDSDERHLAWVAHRRSEEHAAAVHVWNAGVRAEGGTRSVENFHRYLLDTFR
jgi:hypothetical protein